MSTANPGDHGKYGSDPVSGFVVAVCPRCHEQYTLRSDSVGKRILCTNGRCGTRFVVEPMVDVPNTTDSPDVMEGEVVENAEVIFPGMSLESGEAIAGEMVDGMALDEIPILPANSVERVEELSPLQVVPAELDDSHEPPPVAIDTNVDEMPAVVGDTDEPRPRDRDSRDKAKVDSPGARGKAKGKSRSGPIRATAAVLAMSIIAISTAYFFQPKPDPVAEWKTIQDDWYLLKKWKEAKKRFEQYAADHPTEPSSQDVPFFLDMCDAGPTIFSEASDPDASLSALTAVIDKYRDQPQYDRYAGDLFQALQRILERFSRMAERGTDPLRRVAGARQTFELLSRVGKSIEEPWVEDILKETANKLAELDKKVATQVARQQIVSAIERAKSPETSIGELETLYANIERELEKSAELSADAALKQLIREAYASEAQRVKYERLVDDVASSTPPVANDAGFIYVVWDGDKRTATTTGETADKVFFSLARGVLYAFRSDGTYLWARRLGLDSYRQPIVVPATSTTPAAVLAVNTLENSLQAMAVRDGQLLWEYKVAKEHELSAPLTISYWRKEAAVPPQVRGLLATADGEIHVIELVRGRRIGIYQTGCPMSIGGTFDPTTQLVYFPADNKRVFAIDPSIIEELPAERAVVDLAEEKKHESESEANAKPQISPARSVLLTNHASGSLRSPPVIVGPYMVLIETADLDSTRLRVFELQRPNGFAEPQAEPLKTITMKGWAWFASPSSADRLTVVTDDGELGIFGLNLDNSDEALYPLVQDAKGNAPHLPVKHSQRSLAIQSEDQLLWLMVGGELRHYAIDIAKQKLAQVWPSPKAPESRPSVSDRASNAPAPEGVPIHEASFDWENDRIYVTARRSESDLVEMASVNGDSGEVLWNRQLGISPLIDPIVKDSRVALVDQSGRTLQMDLSASADDAALRWDFIPDRRAPIPSGASRIIRDSDGIPIHVFESPKRDALTLRALLPGSKLGNEDRTFRLPSIQFHGEPAIVGEFLVVPGVDGRLHRLPMSAAAETHKNELPYVFAQESTLSPSQRVAVFSAGDSQMLLVNGRTLRLLSLNVEKDVAKWTSPGVVQANAPILGEPIMVGDTVFCVDVQRTLYAVARDSFAKSETIQPRRLQLPGRPTSGPFACGDKVAVIVGENQIVCFDPKTKEDVKPLWASDPLSAHICGRPSVVGSVVLVTDESGVVSALQLDTGKLRGGIRLPKGAAPAAAAVSIGGPRILIPLADGTLLWRSLRDAAPEERLTVVR